MVKVVVVDDSLKVQRSLGHLLGSLPGVDVAGYAEDVPGALSLIEAIRPDVVVIDGNLRDGDRGIDVLRYLARQHPRIKAIALSDFSSRYLREGYLEAGASAYFDKSTEFMQARDWVAAFRPDRVLTDPTPPSP